MLAYHIDDGDYILREGQILELSNDFPCGWYTSDIRELCIDMFNGEGAAHFGMNFLDSTPIRGSDGSFISSLIELCFETVRQKHFSGLPSRMQSLFVCTSTENMAFWRNYVPSLRNADHWIAEGEVAFLANAELLEVCHFEDGREYFDPALARRKAIEYWGTGKLLDATSDDVYDLALGTSDRAFLSEAGVQWGGKAQPEILLEYPVKIVRKC